MNPLAAIAGRGVGQVGLLVRDLDAALEQYTGLWPTGPWHLWTYGPETVPELSYRGRPGCYAMRIALAGTAPQIELIEPLAGPSIYHEWLEEHGEGLHHVAVHVPVLADGLAAMAQHGHAPIQLGRGYGLDGDGGYAYFDLRPALATLVELIEVPRRRRPPERVWPAPHA